MTKTTNVITQITLRFLILFFCINSVARAADVINPDTEKSIQTKISYVPPEVAVGTFSCKAMWNEFCEDQKTIQVPKDHKLCKDTITTKEKTGDTSYQVISKDNLGVTVKFSSKGNGNRLKQEGASIILNISLLGVRENEDCFSKSLPTSFPAPISIPAPTKIQKVETQTIAPAITIPAVAPNPVAITIEPSSTTMEKTPHACACSQWIESTTVYNCLVKGHGQDNKSCDTMNTTIRCVATKDECREIQDENCEQVLGFNQSTSKKRLFVSKSPYCNK